LSVRLPRYSNLWLPGYVRGRMKRCLSAGLPPARVWLAIADHFEPLWNNASEDTASERVRIWREGWPEVASRFQDAAGRPPVYTFFYPEEQYRPSLLKPLAEMTCQGIADVEVHIHHDRQGELDFITRISRFTEILSNRHGLLREEHGQTKFGFIHGNWALDNSLPGGKWCGLNNEIRLLGELGCYADFTMPSGASPTQARTVNEIYWAVEDPMRPKSYDHGLPFGCGRPRGDVLMIPGPLCIRYRDRLLPRLDSGELAGYDPPTPYRVARWLENAPRLGSDIFIKLYSHGAQEQNMFPLLKSDLSTLFTIVTTECRRRRLGLYFVSAWQMYKAIMALGNEADPVATLETVTPAFP